MSWALPSLAAICGLDHFTLPKKNLPFPTKLQKRDAHSAIYLDPLSVIHPVVGGLWLCLPRLRKYLEEQCFTSSFEYSYILGGNSEGLGL